jgi:hypothetical protein
MSFANDSEAGVGIANPNVFLHFTFRPVDDGVLVFDAATGDTSLLPFDRSLVLDFLRIRIAESATGECELQGFISRLGYFPDC